MSKLKTIITPELTALVTDYKLKGIPLYPPVDSPVRFHAAFDGANWAVFQNEEGDKTNDLTATPMATIYECDWDGVSGYVTTTLGTFPGKIPFFGWPQTDVKP